MRVNKYWKLTVYINEELKLFVINYEKDAWGDIVLSDEHQQYKWVDDVTAKKLLVPGIFHDYNKYIQERIYDYGSKKKLWF